MTKALKLGIIAGEESGDLLAADCVKALQDKGFDVQLTGVGGDNLTALGLESLFDPSEIALMGVSEVITKIPNLLKRISQTANHLLAQKPDVILLIDAPDFTHRVAKKIKAQNNALKIVQYVCPSVWAWRPKRAEHMRAFIDAVLAILPFEPEVMQTLKGPKTFFVGHPLASSNDLAEVRAKRDKMAAKRGDAPLNLLFLPGSRTSEIRSLLPDMEATLQALEARGHQYVVHIPTLPRHEARIQNLTEAWPVKPKITTTQHDKWQAFAEADAALAASGTVLLELALANIPMISIYRIDMIMRIASRWMTLWTAALPNIVADRPYVNEYVDVYIRPAKLARELEHLARPTEARADKLAGNHSVLTAMQTDKPAGQMAAEILINIAK